MTNKLFSKHTVFLALSGLAINVILVWLTDILSVPLYCDSIGTAIVAALGGALPGISVGFLSNCVTALFSVSPDPMTLYYGFLNVLIAVIVSWLSKNGLLRKWYGIVIAVFGSSMIGGALGSVITWILYGFSFGQGISAPLASFYFNRMMLSEFPAQFAADMSIDLIDKALTILILCLSLRFLPDKVMEKMPLGYIYMGVNKPLKPREIREKFKSQFGGERQYRKHSINTRVTLIIIVSATILSTIAVWIGISTYKDKLVMQYTVTCSDAVAMMLPKINGNMIDDYLKYGERVEGYAEVRQDLYDIFNNISQLKYMYVYAIDEEGCHVVFDLDTEELEGEEIGAIVPFDDSFPYKDEILAGKSIPAFVTDDTYGWLLTVYKPITDSHKNVVAYAAADIDMKDIKTNIYSFCISVVSLLFGVLIMITTFSLWYCDRRLLDPIRILTQYTRDFDYTGEADLNESSGILNVHTGDELEELFNAMNKTQLALTEHAREIRQKDTEITRMQKNIIFTLANMVENRDGNTGGHIKRTANYVKLIGENLMKNEKYSGIVNESYIKMLYDSAPLHDIGKIKIPDAILNKPGKLTTEEFDEMKTHTTQGRDILETSLSGIEDDNWLSMAVDMAYCHHEKWNGKGYPIGTSGENIPLCARIMAVSDVFDALVTTRSYKLAYTYDEAIAIIKNDSGSHFDPSIVEAFMLSEDEIKLIMKSS